MNLYNKPNSPTLHSDDRANRSPSSSQRKLLHVIIYNNGEAPLAFSAAMRADSRS